MISCVEILFNIISGFGATQIRTPLRKKKEMYYFQNAWPALSSNVLRSFRLLGGFFTENLGIVKKKIKINKSYIFSSLRRVFLLRNMPTRA